MLCVASEIADYVRQWKKGYAEAHSLGALIEYNWIKSCGGITYNHGRFDIDPERTLEAMKRLSNEFIAIQAEGNYDRAKAFIAEWGAVTPEVPEVVSKFSDLPTEVYPLYNITA